MFPCSLMLRRGRQVADAKTAATTSAAEPVARTRLVTSAIAVLAAACVAVQAALAADPLDRSRLVPLARTVVRVEAVADGRVRIGTGITIAPGLLVTNCHVVSGAARVRMLKRGSVWNVVSHHADGIHDLCYLWAPDWSGEPVTIADPASIRLHQRVAALGYTGGTNLSISDGGVLDLHRHDAARIVRTTAGFSSGASGGALVDETCRLVGVLTFRLPGTRDRFYALPVDWIQRFLAIPDPVFDPVATAPPVRAFWQQDIARLPYFMQAQSLEVERRWPELADLAGQWQRDDPESVEPWIAKGKADARTGTDRCRGASIPPRRRRRARASGCVFEFGSISLVLAGSRGADEAVTRLESLDPLLARRLADLIRNNRDPIK